MWWNPFKKKVDAPVAADQQKPKKRASKPKQPSPKDQATKNGEPYIAVLSVELDEDDPGSGCFEFEWNDIFTARLVKAGYKGKNDAEIVDHWYHTICQNVMADMYEQEMADPEKRKAFERKRDIGGGRSEVR